MDGEDREKVDFFESKIRPVLVQHCYECHSAAAGDPGGALRLDSADLLKKGGEHGNPLAGDQATQTLLLKAIAYEDSDLQMPPAGKLPQQPIDDFQVWISQGAVDPRKDEATPAAMSKADLAARHWAFQPVLPVPPEANSIDAILDKGLAQKGLVPNEMASKRELIRRLYNDLLGLAPTYEEVRKWESEPVENYEKWVDELIGSKHFGERMARRWMDVSRYADTKGYVFQEDREYASAWKYRDWLIKSFNQDLTFEKFIQYQIAADRLDAGENHENLDAMGFLTLGRRFLNNENDIADDRIDLVTRGFMGLSVACARCHDHKFDPISMADYYSLHATFVSNKEPKDEPGPLRLVDADNIRPAVIFKRGQAGANGGQVPKKFIQFIASVSRPLETGSGRIELALSVSDPKNPLTSRVIVNRVWGWLMGAPLVDTPSDFGLRSEAPVQLELLERLAGEFQSDGQSLKRLVKRIVMTNAYRRSSQNIESKTIIDPENRYWWRGVRKRLDFESLRDAVLVATQQLNRDLGGKSIKMVGEPYSDRRTVYAYIDRQNLEGLFRSFDFASPDAHVPSRFATTVPQQALFLMNGGMIDHYCTQLAKKLVETEPSKEWSTIVREATVSVLKRDPTTDELTAFESYGKSISAEGANPSIESVSNFIRVLVCTNEFCFVD